jgi:hypothetical protein
VERLGRPPETAAVGDRSQASESNDVEDRRHVSGTDRDA